MDQSISDKPWPKSGMRWAAVAAILFIAGFSALRGLDIGLAQLAAYVARGYDRAVASLIEEFFPTAAYFWGPLATILICERLLPADKSQETLGPGLLNDFIWFLSAPLFAVFLVSRLREFLGTLHQFQLDALSFDVIDNLPVWAKIVVVVLASDFLSWLSHFLRHKIPVLWYFHSIHHSQTELNIFTDHRVHPIEQLFSVLIRFWPMTLFDLRHGVSIGVAWAFLLAWHPMIYHANIRTNYGWLRYLFVTPQSHRVHHSKLPQHQDTNFGTIFSIWDYLFGTQYRNYDEYPSVGVADPGSPQPKTRKHVELLSAYCGQLVYPFRLIVKKGL